MASQPMSIKPHTASHAVPN